MSIADSYQTLLDRIVPSAAETAMVDQHAGTIKRRLQDSFHLKKFLIAGGHARGTSISRHSDVDLFAVFARDDARHGGGYVQSTTLLERLRQELVARYPHTSVSRDVHAIVVAFAETTVDVVPAIFDGMNENNWPLYLMPDGDGWWMRTSPEVHNKYLDEANTKSGGKLRRVARLIKFWRECRTPRVPLSSFHMEMLVAGYETCVGVKSYAACVFETFQVLAQRDCGALRDPLGVSKMIGATPSLAQREAALRSVVYARDHARAAVVAEDARNTPEARRQWNIVFNDRFPG